MLCVCVRVCSEMKTYVCLCAVKCLFLLLAFRNDCAIVCSVVLPLLSVATVDGILVHKSGEMCSIWRTHFQCLLFSISLS
jgi:hypothetical protein